MLGWVCQKEHLGIIIISINKYYYSAVESKNSTALNNDKNKTDDSVTQVKNKSQMPFQPKHCRQCKSNNVNDAKLVKALTGPHPFLTNELATTCLCYLSTVSTKKRESGYVIK